MANPLRPPCYSNISATPSGTRVPPSQPTTPAISATNQKPSASRASTTNSPSPTTTIAPTPSLARIAMTAASLETRFPINGQVATHAATASLRTRACPSRREAGSFITGFVPIAHYKHGAVAGDVGPVFLKNT